MNGEYQINQPKKAPFRIAALALLLLAVLAASFAIYFFTKVNKAQSNESFSRSIVIEKGWPAQRITAELHELGIINNPWIFSIYLYSQGAAGKIQAGEYLLDRKMSMAEIVEIITRGKVIQDERRVTIIEGWNNRQIAGFLSQRDIFSVEEFNEALNRDSYGFKFAEAKNFNYEGFLFPDTYILSRHDSAESLVLKMLKNFESKITAEMLEDMAVRNLSLIDVMILASIIEKEVGRNKERLSEADREEMHRERELVASVFYNRLSRRMPLQSDATVNYVTGKSDRRALIADTQIQSPYNTYQVVGLPPGPISNPGINSIKAAIYPAQSDYLYFLNSPDGKAYFGRTIAEHNENRRRYLE